MRPSSESEAGAAKPKRKQRLTKAEFITAHPICCFCGRRPTAERDHAPARIIFMGKHGPEDFEFPACAPCNRAAALSEQVTAFYIRSIDASASALDEEEYEKLLKAIGNNAPETFPIVRRPRRAGAAWPRPFSPVEERTVTVPEAAKRHLLLFGTKMLYAMHYRLAGTPASSSQRRIVMWAQHGTKAAAYLGDRASEWFEKPEVGTRRNVDLGDQFRYQTGYNPAHGYLGLHIMFGDALIYFCALGPAREMVRLKPKPDLYQSIDLLGRRLKPRRA